MEKPSRHAASRIENAMRPLGSWLRRWRMRRLLKNDAIPHRIWQEATRNMRLLSGLDAVQMARLRELATWFLDSKSIAGARGLEVTDDMRVAVAAQACLLILNLGAEYFEGWVGVVLYPGAFRVSRAQVDAIGLVHDETSDLSGESWLRGPVILSWDDVDRDIHRRLVGRNVVVHEFAHKLDGLNGAMNGMPPLHRGMSRERWAAELGGAYDALRLQVESGEPACIDPYAATSPAEFFAVASEYFFTAPDVLKRCWPGVHEQLALFYRQQAV